MSLMPLSYSRLSTFRVDLRGTQFGLLTAISYLRPSSWRCKCACGREIVVSTCNLRRQNSTSCGCTRIASVRRAITKHGLSKHPLHAVWRGILARCTTPTNKNFPYYGGRGIAVATEWLEFTQFYADLIGSYVPGLQLDRKDNNLGYSKDNVRWTTSTTNNRNKRNARLIPTPDGVMPLWEAMQRSGLRKSTLYSRWKAGWPADAMFRPASPARRLPC